MVKREWQDSFKKAKNFGDGGLVVHAHEMARSRILVVLIHGLGGSGYSTWGILPGLLFDNLRPIADIAVYDYRSGPRMLAGYRGRLEHWVGQIESHLKDLAREYDHVILVGHSQGGVIAERVAKSHLSAARLSGKNADSGSRKVPHPLAGLILISSPRAGSIWVPGIAARLLPSMKQLGVFNSLSADTEAFYSSYVERLNSASSSRPFILPTYACIGGGDRFVSEFSATFGIPADQRKRLSTTHTRIVKPSDKDAELVGWMHDVIGEMLEVREQAQRLHDHEKRSDGAEGNELPTIIAELQADASGFEFEEVYRQQCAMLTRPGIVIVDAYDARSSVVDVLVAAHHADRFTRRNQEVKRSIEAAHVRREQDSAHSVNIYPIGQEGAAAERVVEEWLASRKQLPSLFVTALPDTERFREHLARVLNNAVERKLSSRQSRVVSAAGNYSTSEGD